MNYRSVIEVKKELATLANEHANPVVAVMGLSGAGKTHISKQLAELIPGAVVVSFDWWIKERSPSRRQAIAEAYEADGTMPDPLSWYDWGSFEADLNTLLQTKRLRISEAWNQVTGEKDASIDLTLPANGLVIVEGMYLTEERIAPLIDYTIVVLADTHTAIAASSARRAQATEETYRLVKARWIREYDVPYIHNHLETADAIIQNDR